MTLKEISINLNIDIKKLLFELNKIGIFILNPNKELSNSQITLIKKYISKDKNEKKQNKELKKIVKRHKIFIDTSSILDKNFEIFCNQIEPLLLKYKKKIIIIPKVFNELYNYLENEQLKEKVKKNIKILSKLREKNLIEIRVETRNNFVDNVFFIQFSKYRLKHKLLLITQDKKLSNSIIKLNKIKSPKENNVRVMKISNNGILYDFKELNNYQSNSNKKKSNETKIKITNVPNDIIPIKNIPSIGSNVYTDFGEKIKLISKISSGGEGTVYKTNTNYVCKIYKKEKITIRKFEKLKLMIKKSLNYNGICWPHKIIFNNSGEFVGYLMPMAFGKELKRMYFIEPKKKLINWKKIDAVNLAITILEKINYLHSNNIILGDINPMNILVVNPKEVYFVDTDSYQIERFPCPVGTIEFTPPELQGKNFGNIIRTLKNEYFAIAILLFMLMLPGKHPYSQKGGEDIKKNIKNMNFPYTFMKQTNKVAPEGMWVFIWSHLTYALKEKFFNIFNKNGKYSHLKTRLNTKQWLNEMEKYKLFLENNSKIVDKMSLNMFPTRYKKLGNLIYKNNK
ncbi:hypothetical protein OSSY52_18770 [Tepiditoga spiralis]|uniref:Protein kinase domain-containing protein n=1 Tax=Tepiditoga spiralis TaxID=2108365 RepID=A0A7G1G8J1_9BACT|nr:hypothetical protein [Tepiditoga spiralis]BBE31736.1 hypothetical protein OSSY52_18770 [Tepiditoga spiralis]